MDFVYQEFREGKCLCSRASGFSSGNVQDWDWFEWLSVGSWLLHSVFSVWWLGRVMRRLGWTVTRVPTHSLFMWLWSLTVWQLDLRGSIWRQSVPWDWGRSFKASSQLGSEIMEWHLHYILLITNESQKLAWVEREGN